MKTGSDGVRIPCDRCPSISPIAFPTRTVMAFSGLLLIPWLSRRSGPGRKGSSSRRSPKRHLLGGPHPVGGGGRRPPRAHRVRYRRGGGECPDGPNHGTASTHGWRGRGLFPGRKALVGTFPGHQAGADGDSPTCHAVGRRWERRQPDVDDVAKRQAVRSRRASRRIRRGHDRAPTLGDPKCAVRESARREPRQHDPERRHADHRARPARIVKRLAMDRRRLRHRLRRTPAGLGKPR